MIKVRTLIIRLKCRLLCCVQEDGAVVAAEDQHNLGSVGEAMVSPDEERASREFREGGR